MPGRLMSIKTTSGFICGKSFNASSAFAYWLTQQKPSARLSTRTRVSRNLSLSSTMETVMGINLFFAERNFQAHDRSAVRATGNGKFSANVFHSFSHVAKPSAAFAPIGLCNSTAIVFDFQNKIMRLQAQSNPDFAGMRVFDDVVNGFLKREKNIVP